MNIHEYQGKQILKQFGVAVPAGAVAATPDEAEKAPEGTWIITDVSDLLEIFEGT